MKKLIFITLFIAFAGILFSQTDSYSLTPKEWTKTISNPMGTSASDTLAGTTAVYIVLDLQKLQGTRYYYNHYFYLDSLGDGTNITATLQGSNNNSDWHNIGSAQLWYVTSDDTTLNFSNLSTIQTITSTIAQHTVTTAAATDYISGTIDSVNADLSLKDDTATIAQRVATVAAQTVTTYITDGAVSWNYQRLYLLGAGASAGADISKIEWAFIKPKND